MTKIISVLVIVLLLCVPAFSADITVTGLTDEQATALVGQNVTRYVADFANHLIVQKAADEKFALIRVLTAKTTEELQTAASPIIKAEKARLAAEQPTP